MIISGNPSNEQSAAIATVISQLLNEEATAAAVPPSPHRQREWVRAWRPGNIRTAPRAPIPHKTSKTNTKSEG